MLLALCSALLTLSAPAQIRYLPRQDLPNGRIKDFRVFIQQDLFPGLTR